VPNLLVQLVLLEHHHQPFQQVLDIPIMPIDHLAFEQLALQPE